MKKIITGIIAFTLSIASLTSCGSSSVNPAAVSDGILSGVSFSEQLQSVSEKIALKRLGINAEDVKSCTAYTSTNAVVDEFAVIEAVNVENVEAAIQNHISSQSATYQSYAPDEVSKLKNAVVKTVGDYVIFVVSPDSSAAQSTVNSLVK